MTKKDLLGIAYVSIFVIIWGTIGSLIDFPLLKINLYEAGSLGQLTTFLITALGCSLLGVKLFPVLISNRFD